MLDYRPNGNMYFYQTDKKQYQQLISGKKHYIVLELGEKVFKALYYGKVEAKGAKYLWHGDILRIFYNNKVEEEEHFIVLSVKLYHNITEAFEKVDFKKVYPECKTKKDALKKHKKASTLYLIEVDKIDERLEWIEKYPADVDIFSEDINKVFEKAHRVYETLESHIWTNFDFTDWYYKKVVPGIINHSYNIVMYENDGDVKGICIAKNNQNLKELDIKFLWVDKKYRQLGIASKLVEILKTPLSAGDTYYLTIPAELDIKFKEFAEKLSFKEIFKDCKVIKYASGVLSYVEID